METLLTRAGTEFTGKPLIDEKGKPFYRLQDPCKRCGGPGGAEQWRHTGWTCFRCGGTGKEQFKDAPLYTKEKLDKLNATAAKRQAAAENKHQAAAAIRQAEHEAEQAARTAAFESTYGTLAARVRETCDTFALQVLESCEKSGTVSEKQAAIFERAIAEFDRRKTAHFIGTIGERITVEGIIYKGVALPNVRPFAQQYILLIRTADGSVVKYKGASNFGVVGERVKIMVTVSGHEDYKGELQTVISRPKQLEEPYALTTEERVAAGILG